MTRTNVADLRNIAICGHGLCGKTTLVDKILVKTGAHAPPAEGASICDFEPEEKVHKHTVEAKLVHFYHAGKRFNVFDTPGYPDFIGQTICALSGVDTALIVINAHSGIGVNTRRVFAEAEKLKLGRIIVINKLDTENIDFPGLIDSIKQLWGSRCVPLNVPIGLGHDFKGVASTLNPPADTTEAVIDPAEIRGPLIESIIEVDEQMMERYFEGQEPSAEELSQLMVKAIAEGTLVPILCCAGKNDLGVAELLDALAICALPPAVIPHTALLHLEGKNGHTNGQDHGDQEQAVLPDPAGPLVARVFKTRIDPFVQKLSFIRVYSGVLKKDMTLHASTARKSIKTGQLLEVQANHTANIEEAGPGEIVAMAKMEDLHTGSMLGDYLMPATEFPTPMAGLAVAPKTRGDEAKLSGALHKILEEDPTFHIDRDAQTKEQVMTGMSELHLKSIQEKLARRDKVEVETKEPKIPYRETIQAPAEGSYRHKKQSGGRGQFGEVHIRMLPLPRGVNPKEWATKERFHSMKEYHYDPQNNFLWVNSIVGGTIPGNFLPAIEKGFKERMVRGVIAGYQVQDVAVEVHFGKYHDVDSSEQAFKTAASMAFRNTFQEAKPSLLEPVVRLHITVPEQSVGDIYSDMSPRRGRVLKTDSAGGIMQTVECEAPLSEVTTYARALSSMTGGQGSFTMEFSHYDVVPAHVQQEIVSKAKLHPEEDE